MKKADRWIIKISIIGTLFLALGFLFLNDVVAQSMIDDQSLVENNHSPLIAVPTPANGGYCEVNGVMQTCYANRCEEPDPNGRVNLSMEFRGCNVDGCVYTYAIQCFNGCDDSDPNNAHCIDETSSGEPAEEPHTSDLCAGVFCNNMPKAECSGNTSWYDPFCNPDTGVCEYTRSENCSAAGCNPGTGLCYSEGDKNLCAEIQCEDPVCSPELDQSWSGVSCNPDTGICDQVETITTCSEGCVKEYGICKDELVDQYQQYCEKEILPDCPPACYEGSSYVATHCDPDTDECVYTPEYCEYGCDEETGLCNSEAADGVCAPENCFSYCEGTNLYQVTDCSESTGCEYEIIACPEDLGCNPITASCYSSSGGMELEELLKWLGILGGLSILGGSAVGGGYLGYRLLKSSNIVKKPVQPATGEKNPLKDIFNNFKKGVDYSTKTFALLEKYKFAPKAKDEWLVAKNLLTHLPSEYAEQKLLDAKERMLNPTGKKGKYLNVFGKVVDGVDALIKANEVIGKRGYQGWEKVGAYYVEGTNKVLTTLLTKNPIVSIADQVAGDLTGHSIENTFRAGEENWHKVTKEYSKNIYDVDISTSEFDTIDSCARYVKKLNQLKKAGKIDPAEASRRAKSIYDQVIRIRK